MMRKTKVAHFIRKFLPHFCSFVRNQIMNHKTYEPCIVYKELIDSTFSREIMQRCVSFDCESEKKGLSRVYSRLLYRRPFRRLIITDRKRINRFLRSQNVSILHFHYGTDAGMFIDALKSSGIPSVVSFYGYDNSSFPKWFLGLGAFYLRRVFRYVDYCLAMSQDMKIDLRKIGCPENKIIIHYYGTDVQHFRMERFYEKKDTVTLLTVGYLVPQKGHAFTLRALREVRKHTDVHVLLRIVGTGYLESELREYVDANGLQDCVTFVGPMSHLGNELKEEFRSADVFVHPSVVTTTYEKEGIPGAIIEAMAAGLPVISTYHAGIPYVLQHGVTGYLVREWDIGGLADAIRTLARDVVLRRSIGERGQEYAVKHLDVNAKEAELESIYDYVLGSRKYISFT